MTNDATTHRMGCHEGLEPQEGVKMRKGVQRLVTREKLLKMGKGPVTNANELVIIKG